MYLEAFSAAKDPAHPERNEDRFSARSGRYYAVIDGVTDKSGVPLPDGSSRGQEAGRLIDRTLAALDAEDLLFDLPLASLLQRFEDAFQERYRELGEHDAAAADANLRFGAQLALAVPKASDGLAPWRVVVVGDCGVRLGGSRTLLNPQPVEGVLAGWRAMLVREAMERGATVEDALASGRHYCLEGSARFAPEWAHVVPREAFERLRDEASERLASQTAHLPAGTLAAILENGVRGAARYRNDGGALGQACIDGSRVPLDKVIDEVISPEAAAHEVSIELFSDGYFGTPPARATTVAAWEAHIARVERDDPYKIGTHPATKGSSPGAFTDDRTVLIVKGAA